VTEVARRKIRVLFSGGLSGRGVSELASLGLLLSGQIGESGKDRRKIRREEAYLRRYDRTYVEGEKSSSLFASEQSGLGRSQCAKLIEGCRGGPERGNRLGWSPFPTIKAATREGEPNGNRKSVTWRMLIRKYNKTREGRGGYQQWLEQTNQPNAGEGTVAEAGAAVLEDHNRKVAVQ